VSAEAIVGVEGGGERCGALVFVFVLATMRAQVLDRPGTPLRPAELDPRPLGEHEVRIAVGACGVCRTDLHVRDGELPDPRLPLVFGHEIVSRIVEGGRSGPARSSSGRTSARRRIRRC
jgi:D-arabinose 1-dehydrogenase-like Zn-dependent alcohol dehydrogenase